MALFLLKEQTFYLMIEVKKMLPLTLYLFLWKETLFLKRKWKNVVLKLMLLVQAWESLN